LSDRFKSGDRVGRHRIVRRLGEEANGAMGFVYLAEDEEAGEEVALKFLQEDDSEGRARLKREAESAARIQHPNVVRVHRVDYFENEPFIVLEYVRGQDLATVWPRPPLVLDEALAALRQVAEGLAAVHAKGVVHRDIKPTNILLKNDGRIVIVDFGLGRRINDPVLLTKPNTILGTCCYMSPEQANGDELDTSSDIFSFGLVAFELLTGLNLFRRSTLLTTLHAVATCPIPRIIDVRSDLPAHIAAIIDRCLARKPHDRPGAGEVARRIDTSVEVGLRVTGGVALTRFAAKGEESLFASATAPESYSAAVQQAVDAVVQAMPNREELIVRAMAEITQTLEGFAPQPLSEGGIEGDLLAALESTVDGVRAATNLARSIAAMELDAKAARAQYKGLVRLLEDCERPPADPDVQGRLDLDYYRFLSHELLLIQVAALMREGRWAILDDLLGTGVALSDEPGGPRIVFFDFFSDYLESLEPLAREHNRVSLHADLLWARHGEGPLAGVLPFKELLAADFFLFLRSELSPAEASRDCEWRPWSTLYLREVPAFVLDVERNGTAEELARALGVADAAKLRERMIALAARLRLLWRSGLLSIPLRTEELREIATPHESKRSDGRT
jgi:predicted Ser/Thr protein kinase